MADDGRGPGGPVVQQGLDDLAGEAAVLRVYRQAFAVLARESEKMILPRSCWTWTRPSWRPSPLPAATG